MDTEYLRKHAATLMRIARGTHDPIVRARFETMAEYCLRRAQALGPVATVEDAHAEPVPIH